MTVINIPNALTLLRIALIPVFIYFFVVQSFTEAFWTFSLAGITDFFDGLIARRWGHKTPLGAWLDPAADKLLMTATFVALSFKGPIPWWLTGTVFFKDLVIVSGLSYLYLTKVHFPIRPTSLSKFNTFFQLLVLFLVFLQAYFIEIGFYFIPELYYLYIFTAILTLVTCLHNFLIGLKILKNPAHYGNFPVKKDSAGSQ